MKSRDTHDLVGGIALTVIGIACGLYASRYNMGTAARMGPGYFPVVLGWLLALLGLLVALPAWWRQGKPIKVQWLNLATATASIVLFAALLQPLGVLIASLCAVGLVKGAVVLTLPGSSRTWLPSPPPRCVTKLKTPTTAAATAASTMPRRHDGPGRSARRVTSA